MPHAPAGESSGPSSGRGVWVSCVLIVRLGSRGLCKQPIKGGVALVASLLHAEAEHRVALLGSLEKRPADDLGAAIAEVLEGRCVEHDMSGHPVPREGQGEPLRRRHLAIEPLESVYPVIGMLDKAPASATPTLEFLDHQLVPTTPPLRDQLRLRECLPDDVA